MAGKESNNIWIELLEVTFKPINIVTGQKSQQVSGVFAFRTLQILFQIVDKQTDRFENVCINVTHRSHSHTSASKLKSEHNNRHVMMYAVYLKQHSPKGKNNKGTVCARMLAQIKCICLPWGSCSKGQVFPINVEEQGTACTAHVLILLPNYFHQHVQIKTG